ncbi:unnamed protein product [Caenorhabditis nigoni]
MFVYVHSHNFYSQWTPPPQPDNNLQKLAPVENSSLLPFFSFERAWHETLRQAPHCFLISNSAPFILSGEGKN